MAFVLGTALTWAQKPSSAEADALIQKSREKSLAYARSLPDFVCSEVISRYRLGGDPNSGTLSGPAASVLVTTGASSASPDWMLIDRLAVNLSYFQQREAHELKLLNGKPTQETFDTLGVGVTSTGEFGNILASIFDPDSQATFRWESWKNVRRRPVGVFAYQVEEGRSSYVARGGRQGDIHEAIVGFHGTLDIDRGTGEVVHLELVADRIPAELLMSRTITAVDYDFVEVAGNRYLLPVHSQTKLESKNESLKNDVVFRDYRKFKVSSNVDFGVDKDLTGW